LNLVIAKEDNQPQFLRLSIEPTEPCGEVVRVPNLRDVLVADSVREFERFREKYVRLPMWAPVFDLAAAVIEEEKKRRRPTRRRSIKNRGCCSGLSGACCRNGGRAAESSRPPGDAE
jgi:hypothetical protein